MDDHFKNLLSMTDPFRNNPALAQWREMDRRIDEVKRSLAIPSIYDDLSAPSILGAMNAQGALLRGLESSNYIRETISQFKFGGGIGESLLGNFHKPLFGSQILADVYKITALPSSPISDLLSRHNLEPMIGGLSALKHSQSLFGESLYQSALRNIEAESSLLGLKALFSDDIASTYEALYKRVADLDVEIAEHEDTEAPVAGYSDSIQLGQIQVVSGSLSTPDAIESPAQTINLNVSVTVKVENLKKERSGAVALLLFILLMAEHYNTIQQFVVNVVEGFKFVTSLVDAKKVAKEYSGANREFFTAFRCVYGNDIPLREMPSQKADVIATMNAGALLEVIERRSPGVSKSWICVRVWTGDEYSDGWVLRGATRRFHI